ncbi:hypothetical protein ACOSQ2_013245 [Xanthoceras sorbifolium]
MFINKVIKVTALSPMHGDITKTKRGRLGKGSSDVWTKFTKYGDRTRCNNDSVLSEMSSSIKSKFDKYWGKIEDVNKLLLIIALVLDPRYKLEYVKFCFDDMFDDKKTKELTCDIRELLIQLYECYNGVENILSSDQTSSSVSFDVEKTNENLNFRFVLCFILMNLGLQYVMLGLIFDIISYFKFLIYYDL